ncbi:MAG: peptidoglycan editing factor PgeF [Polyangiaceae bacterium]|nr:peptidoglycan editing factor PgeF [Polyangiaceae bacterium]
MGDDPKAVHTNLRIAAEPLGVSHDAVLLLNQVHGVHVHVVEPTSHPAHAARIAGDAIASRHGSVACGVRVADCAPVLIGDRRSGAVVAVHSGWRGTEQNIVAHAVDSLRALAGGACECVAAIGPHIELCCFEVGHDVAGALQAIAPVPAVLLPGKGQRPHVDLRKILQGQLEAAGVAADQIDHVRGCTVCDGGRFFSYRRDGKRTGRLLAAIVPRGLNAVAPPSRGIPFGSRGAAGQGASAGTSP